ncbi:MAG: lytic transglycosylase domain-containing protein [Limnobacter sp.]|nr:lytic transglycosylase domain-containing protein [Limnobacter sp.]
MGGMPEAHAQLGNRFSPDIAEVKRAFVKGNFAEFTRLESQFKGDSLFRPYLEIWRFRLEQGPNSFGTEGPPWSANEVQSLLKRNANTWAAEELRRDWLGQLARYQNWATYKSERSQLRYRPDTTVECADTMLNAYEGQVVHTEVIELLSYQRRMPTACRAMVRFLLDKQAISEDELTLRALNLVAVDKTSNVQDFINDLSDTAWSKSISSKELKEAVSNPERFLQNSRKSSYSSLALAAALTRLATTDPTAAADWLSGSLNNKIPAHTKRWLWAHIGYRAALLWDTQAADYFKRSRDDVLSHELFEWRVRAALLAENWDDALTYLNTLPEPLASEDGWKYWKGRALAQKNELVEARLQWIQASSPFTFYGKLSLEELGLTVQAPNKAKPVTVTELADAKSNPNLQRALAFYDAGMQTDGFWEFNLQTAQMNDRELLAAANWAYNNQLYDRAISAADRTEKEHDLSLRYLTPFRDNMKTQTGMVGVEEAWVYGVIRQESRFVSIARSHVGANGLMQVMPATASYVAKKIGMKDFSLGQVNEIDTNITLGASYLKMMHEKFDGSLVMASAGYNAGPSRPVRWSGRLPSGKSIEGALFAELIPFDETRSYVQNVLSNTVAYSLLLNEHPISLKQRLGMIQGGQ